MEKLLTSEEVAEYLRVDVVTVRRLVNRGDLTAYRIGGEYRFMQPDIEEFVKRQRVPSGEQGDKEMFRHFTERARKTMALATNEAWKLGHHYIGTEHLLLGLASDGKGVAAQVLASFDFDLDKARQAMLDILKEGKQRSNPALSKIKAAMFQGEVVMQGRQVGLTARAKKVVELAVKEAQRMGHHYIGTEHLLLGILIEGDGLAVAVLEHLGIDLQQVRAKTLEVLIAPQDVTELPNLALTEDEPLQQASQGEPAKQVKQQKQQGQPQTMQGMVVCPQCGNVHPGGYSYCLRCGATLPE